MGRPKSRPRRASSPAAPSRRTIWQLLDDIGGLLGELADLLRPIEEAPLRRQARKAARKSDVEVPRGRSASRKVEAPPAERRGRRGPGVAVEPSAPSTARRAEAPADGRSEVPRTAIPESAREQHAFWHALLRTLPRAARSEVIALRHRVGFEAAVRLAEEMAYAEKLLRNDARSAAPAPPDPAAEKPKTLDELFDRVS